jgi:hypothetical protein
MGCGLNDAQTKLGDFRTSTLHPNSGSKKQMMLNALPTEQKSG